MRRDHFIPLSRLLTSSCRQLELTKLKDQLDTVRTEYVRAEKEAKSAEMNLTLQTVQHEKLVSSLRSQLAGLEQTADLRDRIADLEEKNAQMDEWLKAKCLEIEENDDRFIAYVTTCAIVF